MCGAKVREPHLNVLLHTQLNVKDNLLWYIYLLMLCLLNIRHYLILSRTFHFPHFFLLVNCQLGTWSQYSVPKKNICSTSKSVKQFVEGWIDGANSAIYAKTTSDHQLTNKVFRLVLQVISIFFI